MRITSFCLKRPVTTLMLFLGIILLGVISWYFLPQELFPPLVYPQITVLTKYKQASPNEIESLITRPIEEATGTVNRVKAISSISREGTSIVMAEFEWGTNMDFASLEVREKLDLVKEKLPREAEEPIVMKYNPFEMPMMRINLSGERNPLKLRKIAKKSIKEELEKIEGVGAVEIVGGLEREITVELRENKLRGAQLSILDIGSALEKANLNYPAGTIKEPFFEYLIRTVGEFRKVKEIKNLPIKAEYPIPEEKLRYFEKLYQEKEKEEGVYLPGSERLIFIKDVGNVIDGSKERTSISRYQGKESVILLIRKQSQANAVRLSQKIKDALKDIKDKLPPHLNLEIVYDEAEFIKESLGNVRSAAFQGGVLAFLVILFFLRNIWFSLSVVAAMPLCILIVILLLFLSKMGLNLVSLGGLALGVGMLVDNAIVVLESIFVNPSPNIKEKTVKGTKEVGGAIFGSTLTSVCVFLPMIFVVGVAGQLFKQLAFSVVFSLLASFFVAITILPLSLYLYLKKKPRYKAQKEFKMPGWEKLFDILFKKKILTLSAVGAVFIISLLIFINLSRELFPKVDQHEFIIKVDAVPGTPLEKTDRIVKSIEGVLINKPGIESVTVTVGSPEEKAEEKTIQSQGSHQAQIFVKVNKKLRTTSLIKDLKEELKFVKKKGVILSLLAQESFLKEAFVQQAPLIIQIKGENLDKLKEIGLKLQERIKDFPYLYNVKLDYPPPRPEVKVEVIKDKAFLYQISTQLIAATVNTSLKGRVFTKFKEKGEEYDIRVVLRKKDREKVENLKRLLVHGIFQDKEINVPLMEVARIKRGVGPLEIKRREGERTLLLTASIYRTPLSKVIKNVQKVIGSLDIPAGHRVEISGEAENMHQSFSSLRFALILALVLVFMVVASEFESLWQPFLILFTLPLSLIGVSFILILTRLSLNVISFLGLIMLGGIIVNNGIVLVDYVNFLRREKNIPLEEALKLASLRRIRPIFMTSLTTILGLIPLSLGKGTSLMQPLGIVTMGGLLSSMFLTPVVLPILYYYFDRFFTSLKPKLKISSQPAADISQVSLPEEEIFKEEPALSLKEPLPLETKPALPQKKEEEIVKKEREIKLNPRQEKLLTYLKEHYKISRTDYARLFNISIPTAARDLKRLQKLGLIEAKGPLGPGRVYSLKAQMSTDGESTDRHR